MALADIVKNREMTPLVVPETCDKADAFFFHPLTEAHVLHGLLNIKPNTATGPDDLPAFLLRKVAPAISPAVAHIFNLSLDSGSYPDMWKYANVCPIYKAKGSKADPGNYRPISILPVLARAFEKAASAQLYDYCDRHHIIPPQQFGFRKNSNCEMALISAMDFWLKAVDEGKYAGALLLDLSKAFDCVPHQMLLQELGMAGVGSRAMEWFASYLTGRHQRVCVKEATTQWMPVSRGVPQGSGLSPLLFNIFVRNLPASVESECAQYADDLTNSAADDKLEMVAQKLTASFAKTKEFCDTHELIVNADKTKLIIFKAGNKKIPDDFSLTLDSYTIKPVNSAKLLGFVVDRHFTGADHIEAIRKKCNGLLGVLRRAASTLPRELLRLAYISLIRTHLEFASAVLAPYSTTQLDQLETIQRVAARIILNLPRDAHAAPLLEILRLPLLGERRREHVALLVERALSGRCHPALRDYFQIDASGWVGGCGARIGAGRKRFRNFGALTYNECSFATD